jgi:hypothetical protein
MRQARAFDQDAAFDFGSGKDVMTKDLRREFRNRDAATAALLALLAAGLSGSEGGR